MWRVIAVALLVAGCHASLADGASTDARGARDGTTTSPDAPTTTTDAAPACFNGRVVYLNFDGVTLAQGASDATANRAVWMGVASATIPQYKSAAADRLTQITDVTAEIRSGLSALPVTVVTARPVTAPYVMIVFGGTPALVNVPYIDAVNHLDCGDAVKSDVGIVFDNVSPATTQKAADYAIGSIAYGLGLTGTHGTGDCLCGWNNSCQQGAGPCTLSTSITADVVCAGQTNPQHELATFSQAFCQ